MTYLAPASEQMYFDGAPLAHVVAYQDRQLEARREADRRSIARRLGGRRA